MSDMMTFPATVEEFMEQYKIVDDENVYTNGADLVPIFRMMQWFEHVSATDKNVGTTDTINRQQAIDAVTDELDTIDHVPQWVFDRLEERLKQLTPAQPDITDDARDAFMNLVYDELYSDGDNYRANRIIDAADEYVEYSLAKQSAQLGTNLAEVGTDCISRQAAIDAIGEKSDEIFETKQKGATYPHDDFFQGMAYAENVVKQLPPAQPEIIRCRNCKFASGDSRICMKFGHSPIGELDFCAWAERRTDEE